MDDIFELLINEIIKKYKFRFESEKISYRMGWDAIINGANGTNCHFDLFDTQSRIKAWESGRRDAQGARELLGTL
jgi:hypothetical protein